MSQNPADNLGLKSIDLYLVLPPPGKQSCRDQLFLPPSLPLHPAQQFKMSSIGSLSASIGRTEHHPEEQISTETKRVFTTVLKDSWLLRK